jgi:hypothetical protein
VPRKPVWVLDYGCANTSSLGTVDGFGMKMLRKAGRGFALNCRKPAFSPA